MAMFDASPLRGVSLHVAKTLLTALLAVTCMVAAPEVAAVDGCTAKAVETNGNHLLALVVGVGKYKSPSVRSLEGPPNDASNIAQLLVERYGFPHENVCVIVNEQATTAAFRSMFDAALVKRAKADDVAVLYFAGHGSQAPDENGDEPSGWDQTLLLHDARADGVKDLVDDELNGMLERLYARTKNVVVILDSCNSGSATRGPQAGTFVARYEPPAGVKAPASGFVPGARTPWVPATLPEMVVLTAAADGTSALETGGRGIFTDALIEVLGSVGNVPFTYSQVARQVPSIIAGRSPQIPYFQGKLDREVFGTAARPRPMAWEVKKAGAVIELSGPPLPGMGVNAELRIYTPSPNRAEYGDPSKAKATVVVDSMSGLNAKAHVDSAAQGAPPIAPGDFALIVRPSDRSVQIGVRLRPSGEAGGIPADRAAALREAIQKDPDARAAVLTTEGAGEFELHALADGRLRLCGVGDEIRATFRSDGEVVTTLWQLARQKALASLRGEGQPYFTDDETLKVEILPAPMNEQGPCGEAKVGEFVPRPLDAPTAVQAVPLCLAYNVRVTVSEKAQKSLVVGGVMLSGEGGTFGFPIDGSTIVVKPGESYTFRERFRASPPLGATDTLKVIGTLQTNQVPWYLLASAGATRDAAAKAPKSALHRALDRYLVAGTRSSPIEGVTSVEDTQWTVSTVTIRVEANPSFLEVPPGTRGLPQAREYTIRHFDLRPYLPDDRQTALYRVLTQADALAQRQLSYKQHPWNGASDEDNLRLGIDCSRALWFAFTRAGLAYSETNAYLSTADMVAPNSRMVDDFDRCDGQPRQLGDVVVYRDDQRGDGHVVMVIDPQRRIAWGSHGWDGNAAEMKVEPETGVEYQLIKYKPDWKRWDRTNMAEKACWRYRRFADEAKTPAGRPGADALGESPCAAAKCSGAQPTSHPMPGGAPPGVGE
jgi:hypothetical protein